MRKDSLLLLIKKNPNLVAKLVNLIIDESYSEVPNDGEIKFAEIFKRLKESGISTQYSDKSKTQYSDTENFYLLISNKLPSLQKEEKQAKFNLLDSIPKELLVSGVFKYLDANSLGLSSIVSKDFNQKTKDHEFWLNKIIARGCEKSILDVIFKNKLVENFRNLYAISKHSNLKSMNLFDLLILSGERFAIDYALNKYGENYHSASGNALHIAAASGKLSAFKYVIKRTNLDPRRTNNKNMNLLHCAATSDSPQMVDYVIESQFMPIDSVDDKGMNALHHAAQVGSVKNMLHLSKKYKIPSNSRSYRGANALIYAAVSNNPGAIDVAITVLQNPKKSVDIYGYDALLEAATTGNIRNFLHCINKHDMDPHAKTNSDKNILHLFANIGSIKGMRLAHEEYKIPADSINIEGINVLDFASMSGSVKAMQYADKELKVSHEGESKDGLNTLLYATLGGNPLCMDYAFKNFNNPSDSKAHRNVTVFLSAAASGFVPAMKYSLKTLGNSKLDKSSGNLNGLLLAALSGSLKAVKYANEELVIPINEVDIGGNNALHFSALSGNIQLFDYVLKHSQIDPAATTNREINILHYAAESGSSEMVAHIRILAHQNNWDIQPSFQDFNEKNAYDYARKSGNVVNLYKILDMDIDDLIRLYEKKPEPSKSLTI